MKQKIHYGVVYYSYEELKSEMNDISIITTNEELKKNQVGKVLFNTGSSFWLQQSSEVPDGHVLRLYAVAKVRILPGPYSSLNKNSEAAIAVSLIKSINFGSVQFTLLVISLLSDPIAAVQMI